MPIEAQGGLNNLDALARAILALQTQTAPFAFVYQGPFAGRPAPTAVPPGSAILATDIGPGGSVFRNQDGANWRPLNGRAVMYQRGGSLTNPIATLNGNGTQQFFTLPDTMLVPAGMPYAGSKINVQCHMRRTANGGGASVTAAMFYGPNNSTSDFSLNGVTIASGTTQDWDGDGNLIFRGTAEEHRTSFSARNSSSNGYWLADLAVNTAAPTYLNFGCTSSLAAGDTVVLLSYQVTFEG